MLKAFRKWLEKRRNARRYRRDQDEYEAAVGANLRFVEERLKKRVPKKA